MSYKENLTALTKDKAPSLPDKTSYITSHDTNLNLMVQLYRSRFSKTNEACKINEKSMGTLYIQTGGYCCETPCDLMSHV